VSSIIENWVVKFGAFSSVIKVKGTHCKRDKDVEELAKECEKKKS
jgi:hypothetical protein